jgi:hypothetical protein
MPLQNRVTPFGDIVAIPQRGMFTGNRGIIHDPATRTLLNRRWSSKAWLICSCQYKGVRREMMATRSWTELFFLDEATALAAGHRPCFVCRREAANSFRKAWADGRGIAPPSAAEVDSVLHRERQERGRKRIHPLNESLRALPDGVVVVLAGQAYTLTQGLAFRWNDSGYSSPVEIGHADGVLTPPSSVLALKHGYRPVLHPALMVVRGSG